MPALEKVRGTWAKRGPSGPAGLSLPPGGSCPLGGALCEAPLGVTGAGRSRTSPPGPADVRGHPQRGTGAPALLTDLLRLCGCLVGVWPPSAREEKLHPQPWRWDDRAGGWWPVSVLGECESPAHSPRTGIVPVGLMLVCGLPVISDLEHVLSPTRLGLSWGKGDMGVTRVPPAPGIGLSA